MTTVPTLTLALLITKLPEYVSVSQHPFEPLLVSHCSHLTNFSDPPPPVQKAIVKVYVVHVGKSFQSMAQGRKSKGCITAWDYVILAFIIISSSLHLFMYIICAWSFLGWKYKDSSDFSVNKALNEMQQLNDIAQGAV